MPCFRGVFRDYIFIKIGKIAPSANILGILDLKYLNIDRKISKKLKNVPPEALPARIFTVVSKDPVGGLG